MPDIFTISSLTATTSVLAGLAMVLFSTLQASFRGYGLIGLSFILLGCGTGLSVLRDVFPPAATVLASNTVVVLGAVALQEGLALFMDARPRSRVLSALLVGGTAAVMYRYCFVEWSLAPRAVWMGAVFTVVSAQCAVHLGRRMAGRRLASQLFTMGAMVVSALTSGVKTVATILWPPTREYLRAGPAQSVPQLIYLLLMVVIVFGVAWMSIQRYELRIAELTREWETPPRGGPPPDEPDADGRHEPPHPRR